LQQVNYLQTIFMIIAIMQHYLLLSYKIYKAYIYAKNKSLII